MADNARARQTDERDKEIILKNCAPFTNCISEINNTYIDIPKDLDVAMLLYNLIKYSDSYLETSGSLWNTSEIRQIII